MEGVKENNPVNWQQKQSTRQFKTDRNTSNYYAKEQYYPYTRIMVRWHLAEWNKIEGNSTEPVCHAQFSTNYQIEFLS